MKPNSREADGLVKIGFVRRRHGLKGAVIVSSLTDYPDERFAPGSPLLVSTMDELFEVEVLSSAPYKDAWLLHLQGMESPEDASSIKGAYLCIRDHERAELAEGEFYEDQLLGLQVQSASGQLLGRVRDVQTLPAHPVLELDSGRSVPFVRDFVETVDLQQRILFLRREIHAH